MHLTDLPSACLAACLAHLCRQGVYDACGLTKPLAVKGSSTMHGVTASLLCLVALTAAAFLVV